MSGDLRLVIFDVDGTLIDSQADILAAMQAAFAAVGRDAPARDVVLSIVGLSLDTAISRLAPEATAQELTTMIDAYKQAYVAQQKSDAPAPLYPGVRAVLERLAVVDNLLLGVATGKSRRGLTAVLAAHGLERIFVTEQVSDFHPSKPHPGMLHAALAETGLGPDAAVMIGDTSFDMDMAQAAGIFGIGVSWGYHEKSALRAAGVVIDDIFALPEVLNRRWGLSA